VAAKIDPLNKKVYGPVTAMLTVSDVKAATAFYQKAFGFAKRGIMNGPDGKAVHAELNTPGRDHYAVARNAPDGLTECQNGWGLTH
jgi:uncharacterized glyoxalase superfamily protein PhnB